MMGLVFTSLLLAALPEPAQPAAMVLLVTGTATLERDKKKQPLPEGELLLPGDRIGVEGGAEVIVVCLHDGHRERLKAGTDVSVGPRGCTPAEAIPEAAKPPPSQMTALRQHLKDIHARGGRSAGVQFRGDRPEQVPVVRPMFGARVLTDHPTLSWPPVLGAESYEVTLSAEEQGKKPQVLWRVATKDTALPFPEEENVLPMWGAYRWRVEARLAGGKGQQGFESKFFTVREGQLRELRQLRRLADSADPGDWLLAAVLYEARGVHDKALPLYEKLARRSPRQVNFQLALAAYYRQAGRPDKAEEAMKRAMELGAPPPRK